MVELFINIAAAFVGFFQSLLTSSVGAAGLLIVPGLLAMGIPAHLTLGTIRPSYLGSNAVTAWRYKAHGYVSEREGLIMTATSFIGAIVGARLILNIDEKIATYIIIAASVITVAFMILKRDAGITKKGKLTPSKLAVVGFVVGLVSGAVGVGAQVISMLSLLIIGGYTIKETVGLGSIRALGNQSAALIVYALSGKILWDLSLFLLAGSVVGAFVGSEIGHKIPSKIIKPLFIITVVLLLVKIVFF